MSAIVLQTGGICETLLGQIRSILKVVDRCTGALLTLSGRFLSAVSLCDPH